MIAGTGRLLRIRELEARGASLRQIGRELGISHVRVLQIKRAAAGVVRVSGQRPLTPASGEG